MKNPPMADQGLKLCPFCGELPFVGPHDPNLEGNAFGYVECQNEECAANPSVEDGESACDDRGSDFYKNAAIIRWNRRA